MASKQLVVKIRIHWRWWAKPTLFVVMLTNNRYLLRLVAKHGYTVEQETREGWKPCAS